MPTDVTEKINRLLTSHRIVLFMKGTRDAPQCGFSARVVDLLEEYGAEYADVDVLADPELRHGLKTYSDWQTFPQLYIDSRLVGGCDIVTELEAAGQLEPLLNAPSARARVSN